MKPQEILAQVTATFKTIVPGTRFDDMGGFGQKVSQQNSDEHFSLHALGA